MLGTGTGLAVGFAHAHSVSPFTWFRLNQLTLFRRQEETLEIAMRGWHQRRRPPPHWTSTPRLRRHMSATHERRTASMPSWCSHLMRPIYGCGSSARRMPDSMMLVSISSSTTGTNQWTSSQFRFPLEDRIQLMHTNGAMHDCSDTGLGRSRARSLHLVKDLTVKIHR
jgi:hypothetical protein